MKDEWFGTVRWNEDDLFDGFKMDKETKAEE